MKQTIIISICLTVAFLTIPAPETGYGAPGSVKDCIENEDCLEEPANEQNGAVNGQNETSDTSGGGSLFFNLVRMVFALLLVLGLIYALLKFLRKRNKLFQQVKALENLGGISVGSNKSVQLVRIGSKIFLVGVGENVELLKEISEDDIKDEILSGKAVTESQSSPMMASLFKQKNSQADQDTSKNSFTQLFSKELEKMKQTRHSMINQQKQKEDKDE